MRRTDSDHRGASDRLPVILLCTFLAATVSMARPLYPHPSVSVGVPYADPVGLLASDLDDDGHLDLVAGVFDQDALSVMLGNGDGTFAPAIVHPIDCALFSAAGDFDADGKKDLAVSTCNGATVFLGNGDGTFVEGESYLTDGWSLHVAVADFNEDDRDDLLYVGWFDPLLRLGNGDGTFGPEIDPGADGFDSLAVADFNGDGFEDFAARDAYAAVGVWLGNGDGTFVNAGPCAVGDSAHWVAAGDLDNDDIPDLAVTNEDSDDLSVLLGNGDGTFAAEQRYAVAPPGEVSVDPWYVAITDLDKDGSQDLAVSNYWSSSTPLALLRGTGGGQFASFVEAGAGRQAAYSIAVGDFDEDGVTDLARPSYWQGDVGVLFGVGDGTLATPVRETVGELPRAVAVADLDGDGRQDIVTANETSNDVSVLLADAAASFAPETRYPVGTAPVWVAVGELTGDTDPDIAVANSASGNVSVLEGDGAGGFSTLATLGVGDIFFPATPSSVAVGDFDADDVRDLVVTDRQLNRVAVLMGTGGGSFDPPLHIFVGVNPTSVIVDHLDAGDAQDLAVTNSGSDSVSVLLGTGDGGFVAAPALATNAGPTLVASGDTDGDSNPDLVVSNLDAGDVQVFSGSGDGTFGAPVATPFGVGSLALADLDGDGRLDLANAAPMVRPGNGDGTFGPQVRFVWTAYHEFVAVGDFDLDALTDLAIANNLPSEPFNFVSIHLNQGGPRSLSFAGDKETLVWPAVVGALTYDVYRGVRSDLVDGNGDGLPDDGYGVCLTGLDDDARDTVFDDPDLPASDDGFFYLTSVQDAGGDRGIGTTSTGLPRSPAVACP
jgi:hypothetical protein